MSNSNSNLQTLGSFCNGLIDEFGNGQVVNYAAQLFTLPSILASQEQSDWFIAQWSQLTPTSPDDFTQNSPITHDDLYGNAIYSWTTPGSVDAIALYQNTSGFGGGDVLQLSDGAVQNGSTEERDNFLSSPAIPASMSNLGTEVVLTLDAKLIKSFVQWVNQSTNTTIPGAGPIWNTLDIGFSLNYDGAAGVSPTYGFVQAFPWSSGAVGNPGYESGSPIGFISSLLLGDDTGLPLLPSDANALPDKLTVNVNNYVYTTLEATYSNSSAFSVSQKAALLNLSNWSISGMYIGLATTTFAGNGTVPAPETTATIQLSNINLTNDTSVLFTPTQLSQDPSTIDMNPQIRFSDATLNQSGSADGGIYVGAFKDIQDEYLYNGYDQVSLSAPVGTNWYFGGGYGLTSLTATAGNNVFLSSFAGSSMTGGSGDDTFIIQSPTKGHNAIQNQIINFHPGDSTTLKGLGGPGWTFAWMSSGASSGTTYLSLYAKNAMYDYTETIQFTGLSTADLQNLVMSNQQSTSDFSIDYEAGQSVASPQSVIALASGLESVPTFTFPEISKNSESAGGSDEFLVTGPERSDRTISEMVQNFQSGDKVVITNLSGPNWVYSFLTQSSESAGSLDVIFKAENTSDQSQALINFGSMPVTDLSLLNISGGLGSSHALVITHS